VLNTSNPGAPGHLDPGLADHLCGMGLPGGVSSAWLERHGTAPIMLSDAEVAGLLDLDTAIAAQRGAFVALGNGTAQLAEKMVLPNLETAR